MWNAPLGDEAIFDPRPVVPGPVNINSASYGVSIGGAGIRLSRQNPNSEQHEFQVQADNVTAFGTSKWLNAFGEHVVIDLRESGLDISVAGTLGHYERATKMSGYGGALRDWELQAAALGDVHAIKHAMALAVSSHVLNQSHVWPRSRTTRLRPGTVASCRKVRSWRSRRARRCRPD